MNAAKIKGSLLEYLVRRMLTNCGFKKVSPDGRYIFEDRGLNFIHGKGAAHDADVLMDPPIQMPFSYPSRINFECKAYNKKTGLGIVRNALGLRYDINEFEILTDEQLQLRHNLRRQQLAIANRVRYNYQVGVASVEDFSKDAFEFAANNKIPLISLRWLLDSATCDLFHEITDDYLSNIYNEQQRRNLLLFLKGNGELEEIINVESHIQTIINSFESFERRVLIGLLESGDMIFLLSQDQNITSFLRSTGSLTGQYYYYPQDELDNWELIINGEKVLRFYLPQRIVNIWRNEEYDADVAIGIKERWFVRMFIFYRDLESRYSSFKIVNLDERWINDVRNYR